MRRTAELMFIAGVLATTCCGCRWCGTDWENSMTKEQTNQVRALVDTGGWDAVRKDPELSKVWADHLKESKEYADKVVDQE